jgi:hypothetical protein
MLRSIAQRVRTYTPVGAAPSRSVGSPRTSAAKSPSGDGACGFCSSCRQRQPNSKASSARTTATTQIAVVRKTWNFTVPWLLKDRAM